MTFYKTVRKSSETQSTTGGHFLGGDCISPFLSFFLNEIFILFKLKTILNFLQTFAHSLFLSYPEISVLVWKKIR